MGNTGARRGQPHLRPPAPAAPALSPREGRGPVSALFTAVAPQRSGTWTAHKLVQQLLATGAKFLKQRAERPSNSGFCGTREVTQPAPDAGVLVTATPWKPGAPLSLVTDLLLGQHLRMCNMHDVPPGSVPAPRSQSSFGNEESAVHDFDLTTRSSSDDDDHRNPDSFRHMLSRAVQSNQKMYRLFKNKLLPAFLLQGGRDKARPALLPATCGSLLRRHTAFLRWTPVRNSDAPPPPPAAQTPPGPAPPCWPDAPRPAPALLARRPHTPLGLAAPLHLLLPVSCQVAHVSFCHP